VNLTYIIVAAGPNIRFGLFFIRYLDYIVEEVINVVRLIYKSVQVLLEQSLAAAAVFAGSRRSYCIHNLDTSGTESG
jgi:hypothetical protein